MEIKMSLTLVEVCDKLKGYDEITLLEVLDISSEELVERFVDIIEERYDDLARDLEEPEED
jgi:hypothetical protein